MALVFAVGNIVFVKGANYQSRVENQWTRQLTVAASRGTIYDSKGKQLAESATCESVLLRPRDIADPGEVASLLAPILGLDNTAVFALASDTKKVEVRLKRQITSDQAAKIRRLKLPGVDFFIDTKRFYPNNAFLSQVLGFTNIDGVGQEGLERKYDKYMAGQQGQILVQVDGQRRTIDGTERVFIEPSDGLDIYLTVDEIIQSFTETAAAEALEINNAKNVTIIVLRPESGDILGMATLPEANPNVLPRDNIEELNALSRNIAIVDAYEPGSTFKVITTAAALDSKAINTESTFDCPGFRIVDGEKIKCWRTGRPHGHQNLFEAVQNSCNPAFMDMAVKMGTPEFYSYISSFGFGKVTGIDFSADGAGIVRDQKYIKSFDLARIGFGQSIAVTPLQLATAISAVVNGGTLYKPRFVSRIVDKSGNVVENFEKKAVRQVISSDTSALMRQILESVVTDGSGANAKIDGYRVGGKTGTAQLYKDGKIVEGKHISSFVGFAPADDPKFLVLCVVYEPNVYVDFGSVVAAPFVRDILEKCLKYENHIPGGLSVEQVEVPDVTGKTPADAVAALKAVGLAAEYDMTGTVLAQLPAAGTVIPKGSVVYLSAGEREPDEITPHNLPSLEGKTLIEAVELLKPFGIALKLDGAVGNGIIVSQFPAPGTEVDKIETVSVVTATQ